MYIHTYTWGTFYLLFFRLKHNNLVFCVTPIITRFFQKNLVFRDIRVSSLVGFRNINNNNKREGTTLKFSALGSSQYRYSRKSTDIQTHYKSESSIIIHRWITFHFILFRNEHPLLTILAPTITNRQILNMVPIQFQQYPTSFITSLMGRWLNPNSSLRVTLTHPGAIRGNVMASTDDDDVTNGWRVCWGPQFFFDAADGWCGERRQPWIGAGTCWRTSMG